MMKWLHAHLHGGLHVAGVGVALGPVVAYLMGVNWSQFGFSPAWCIAIGALLIAAKSLIPAPPAQ